MKADKSIPQNLAERKWKSLATNCLGSWSGTIGFYKCKIEEESDGNGNAEKRVIPDDSNNSRNMRVSAQLRASDPDIIDWTVYNVRKNGEKIPIVIYKDDSKNPYAHLVKTTNCFFDDGIITRHGKKFDQETGIEMGFWNKEEKMRRSIVIEYDDSGNLSSICYLQLAKKPDEFFDVTAIDLDHVADMPKESPSLEQLRSEWIVGSEDKEKSQTFDVAKNEYQTQQSDEEGIRGVMQRLLGNEDIDKSDTSICRMTFPSGVAIACPWTIKDCKKKEEETQSIIVGYKYRCGKFQSVEYVFDRESMRNVNVRYGAE